MTSQFQSTSGQVAYNRQEISVTLAANSGSRTLLTIPIGSTQDMTVRATIQGADGAGKRGVATLVGQFYRVGSASAATLTSVYGAPFDWPPQWVLPSLTLSGNSVLVVVTPDTINSTLVDASVEIETRNTASVPAAAADPLGTLKALVQSVGGFVLQADAGVRVDATNPGYCDRWTDQANGATYTADADARDLQISTLSDATTPALIATASRGIILDGDVPPMAVAHSHIAFIVFEPNGLTESMAWTFSGGQGIGYCQVPWTGGGASTNKHGATVDGVNYLVTTENETTDLQILAWRYDMTQGSETLRIERDGQLMDSFDVSAITHYGFTVIPISLLKYGGNNSNGTIARVAAMGLINDDSTETYSLLLAALRAKYPGLPQS